MSDPLRGPDALPLSEPAVATAALKHAAHEEKAAPNRAEIVNSGRGLSVEEASAYMAETGLAAKFLNLDEEPPEDHGLSVPRKALRDAQQASGVHQQVEAQQAAQQRAPQPGQPPEHVVPALQALERTRQLWSERAVALQTLQANRKAFIAQNGLYAVVEMETRLRHELDSLDAHGHKVHAFITGESTKIRQAAEQAKRDFAQSVALSRQRELKTKYGISDSTEFDAVRERATKLARADGWTTAQMSAVMADDAAVRKFAWPYFEAAASEHKAEEEAAERKALAAQRRRAAAKREGSKKDQQWGVARDHGLSDAAAVFARLGIV